LTKMHHLAALVLNMEPYGKAKLCDNQKCILPKRKQAYKVEFRVEYSIVPLFVIVTIELAELVAGLVLGHHCWAAVCLVENAEATVAEERTTRSPSPSTWS